MKSPKDSFNPLGLKVLHILMKHRSILLVHFIIIINKIEIIQKYNKIKSNYKINNFISFNIHKIKHNYLIKNKFHYQVQVHLLLQKKRLIKSHNYNLGQITHQ